MNKNLSNCASGNGYVPSNSREFWVATTQNKFGNGKVSPSNVTCCSAMASSKAAWVFGGVRLISSANNISVKIGPFFKVKLRLLRSNILVPNISDGRISGVSWTLLNSAWINLANTLTVRVFPVPGTPSIMTWPPVNKAINNCWTGIFWPTIIWLRFWYSWVNIELVCVILIQL